MRRVAEELASRGVVSDLFYAAEGRCEKDYVASFERAFPLVEPELQLREAGPDLIYFHRFLDARLAERVHELPLPCVRFFHDHELSCLRDYKYTLVGLTHLHSTHGQPLLSAVSRVCQEIEAVARRRSPNPVRIGAETRVGQEE